MCYMPICDLCLRPAPVGKTLCHHCNLLVTEKIKEISLSRAEKEEKSPVVVNSGVNHFGSGQKE